MCNDVRMIERLNFSKPKLDIVIDTDAYNEVDDQFAIVYALKSPERFRVRAIYACPFYKPEYNKRSISPEDGMEKSYHEILDLLELMGVGGKDFVYKGSRAFLEEKRIGQESEAVRHFIQLVMKEYTPENPLTVIAIGALTNIASAILLEPDICERVNICWLGGPIHSWKNASEFNMHQDLCSTQVVFESDVALTQVPCFGVSSHLLTSLYELEHCMDLSIPVNQRLVENFRGYADDHFAYSKEIWDIAPFAVMMNPEVFASTFICRRPIVTRDETYSTGYQTKFMKVVETLNRNKIFKDLYTKLNQKKQE